MAAREQSIQGIVNIKQVESALGSCFRSHLCVLMTCDEGLAAGLADEGLAEGVTKIMLVRPTLMSHAVALSVISSLVFSSSLSAQTTSASSYIPTPAPHIADPTLEPIASDEPVPPAGFPPLPDQLNLDDAIASSQAGSHTAQSSSYGSSQSAYGRRPVQPSFHQGYGHVPAGAYMQQQLRPPASQVAPGSDSYNVNSGNRGPATQSAVQAAPHLPELPTPVTVSQSTTQDLSLPDDEFSDYHKQKRRHYNYVGNMLRGYAFGAAGMAAGMGLGGLRY